MKMKVDQERVRHLVTETVTALCKNGLKHHKTISVQGLIGVTLDDSEVFLIRIDEPCSSSAIAEVRSLTHAESLCSSTVHSGSSHTHFSQGECSLKLVCTDMPCDSKRPATIITPEIEMSSVQHSSNTFQPVFQWQATTESQQAKCNQELLVNQTPIIIDSYWTEQHSILENNLIELMPVDGNQLPVRPFEREDAKNSSRLPELCSRSSSLSCFIVSSDDSELTVRGSNEKRQVKQESSVSDDETIVLSSTPNTPQRTKTDNSSCVLNGRKQRQSSRKQSDMTHSAPANTPCASLPQQPEVRTSPVRAATTGVKGRSLVERRVFSCPDCDKRFTFIQNLRMHQRRQHSSPSGSTSTTTRKSRVPSVLRTILQRPIAKRRVITCPDCDMRFTDPRYLIRHQRLKHCSRLSFSTFKPTSSAVKLSTSPELCKKMFVCGTCGKAFTQRRLLLCHRQAHAAVSTQPNDTSAVHQPATAGKDRESLVCATCGKKFYQVSQLNEHVNSKHTGERPFKCTLCGKTFCSNRTYNIHKYWVHDSSRDSTTVCGVCKKSFSSPSSLLTHKRLHTGVKPFTCPHCNTSFTLRHHLRIHIRTHK